MKGLKDRKAIGRNGISNEVCKYRGEKVSSILFNFLLADLEEKNGKRGMGRDKVGGGKVYSLTYADGMILMAEEKMRTLMKAGGIFRKERIRIEHGKDKGDEV